MLLQHSGGLLVGYTKDPDSRSGYKVLGLVFRGVYGWFFLGFLWGFLVFGVGVIL